MEKSLADFKDALSNVRSDLRQTMWVVSLCGAVLLFAGQILMKKLGL